MRQFQDNAGRTWTVGVNVSAIKRVRGLTGVDLLGIADGSLIRELATDPVKLCDVIYAVCQPEAEMQGVSDEDFGRAMAGDAIEQATEALMQELLNFCPSPKDRVNLGQVWKAMKTTMDRARDVIEERVTGDAFERLIESALASARNSSGSAPAPSVSIPESSPSAS